MYVVNSIHAGLVYNNDFQHCNAVRQGQVDDGERNALWREKFDSISKDFLSSLDNTIATVLGSRLLTKIQKWLSLFGKHWLMRNKYNNEDTKLMKWLMTGANHGTVDTCGENVSFATDACSGTGRLVMAGSLDNQSKRLKLELGQQLPITNHRLR